ncbi:hypothetical protein P3S67_005031 [Capsicum chacoense]
MAHKISHWDYFVEESEFDSIFDDAMSSDSRLISNLLISDCCRHVFEGLTLLVDFGGGIGAMAMAIVEAFSSLKCIVLDLSPVIGDLKGTEIWNLLPGVCLIKLLMLMQSYSRYILLTSWNVFDEFLVRNLTFCDNNITYETHLWKLMFLRSVTVK